jgi:uncharacterized protein
MPELDEAQPEGTPTWIDLGIPDLDRAIDFYGAVFGWEFVRGNADNGYYTMCLLRGKPVAALMQNVDADPIGYWWNLYFAVNDCEATASKAKAAGAELLQEPMQAMEYGKMAVLRDPTGGHFALWQAGQHIGAQIVNEPNSMLRNDLVTPRPGPARDFYTEVFGFTLDGDSRIEGADFTFLRRPDGHEIGGILGDPSAKKSEWGVLFAVDDVDTAVARIREAGGSADDPFDMEYGRLANARDPFGTPFSVGA